jgi:hypothetical protein
LFSTFPVSKRERIVGMAHPQKSGEATLLNRIGKDRNLRNPLTNFRLLSEIP